LPQSVVDAFDDCDPVCEKYWFWNGTSDKRSITGNWQRRFQKLFTLSGIEQAHPHRFRDTFAVGLLEQGIDIETVAVLHGHSSSAITRKHYNPWVKSRQDQLEAAVRKTW
jgi:integrase/recombinase XerD